MFSGRRLLTVGVAVVLVLTLIIFGLAGKSSPRGGRIAPALPSATLNGSPVTLADLRGKPVFVVFWASWCGPCHQEAPALERFAQSPAGRGRIVAVDWNDPEIGQARSFVRQYGWTFPVLRDSEGTIDSSYGFTNLPTTFLVDSHGRIHQTLSGPQTEQTLDSALSQISAS